MAYPTPLFNLPPRDRPSRFILDDLVINPLQMN